MADEADIGNENAEDFREYNQNEIARLAGVLETTAKGYCLNIGCGEPLDGDKRWCNAECRDLWERDKKCM